MREVDCRYVAQRVNQFLDGELDEAEADDLRHHIDACGHCLDEADLLDALKRLIRRASTCPQAPEALRLRVVTQIHSVCFTVVDDPAAGQA